MKIAGLIWFQDVLEKLAAKHGVQHKEVEEVFADHPRFRFVEKGHRAGENVYTALGKTSAGRHLIIFFILKKDQRALVLSARNMSDAERKRYEKK